MACFLTDTVHRALYLNPRQPILYNRRVPVSMEIHSIMITLATWMDHRTVGYLTIFSPDLVFFSSFFNEIQQQILKLWILIVFIWYVHLSQSKQTTNFAWKNQDFSFPNWLLNLANKINLILQMQNADFEFKIRRRNENLLVTKIIPWWKCVKLPTVNQILQQMDLTITPQQPLCATGCQSLQNLQMAIHF